MSLKFLLDLVNKARPTSLWFGWVGNKMNVLERKVAHVAEHKEIIMLIPLGCFAGVEHQAIFRGIVLHWFRSTMS